MCPKYFTFEPKFEAASDCSVFYKYIVSAHQSFQKKSQLFQINSVIFSLCNNKKYIYMEEQDELST